MLKLWNLDPGTAHEHAEYGLTETKTMQASWGLLELSIKLSQVGFVAEYMCYVVNLTEIRLSQRAW